MNSEIEKNEQLGSNEWPKRTTLIKISYGLLGLALLYTLYFAQSLLIPIVVAVLFSLLLSPLVTGMKSFNIPRTLSAFVLLAVIGGPFAILVIELAEPAQKWLSQVPHLSSQITEEINDFTKTSKSGVDNDDLAEKKPFSLFGFFDEEKPELKPSPENTNELSKRVIQGGTEIMISVLAATPVVIAQFITFIILVLFLLIFGPRLFDNFLTNFIEKGNRASSIALVCNVQKELSRYILTVSLINIALGSVVATVFLIMDIDDALLWGALVALLNFAPYVGPLVVTGILSLTGIVQFGMEWAGLIPAATYFLINLVEAQFITPAILGRHMRLNPLILVLWLLVWGWLWGPVGVLLAVPLLVCLKLTASQLNVFPRWINLIETRT
jgi:predicted PurR-regulated permease PerM